MEKDELKELFSAFNPPLSEDKAFMERLERNMRAADAVKAELAASRRAGRRALATALIAGFVAGVVFTALLPVIQSLLTGLLPDFDSVVFTVKTLSWIVALAGTCLIGLVSFYQVEARKA